MMNLALIALGGSVGAMARYGLSVYISRSFSQTFPLGTFAVNMLGSLLIGILIEMYESAIIPPEWRGFLMIGLLGAFTTFSTFSLETVQLIRDNELGLALLNAVGSLVFGLLFVYAGLYAGKLIFKAMT